MMESKYRIEKNIPPPEDSRGLQKYPFKKMEIGDSFFVPAGKAKSVRQQVQYYQKRSAEPVRFTVRQVEGGVRVWRVEPRPGKKQRQG